MKKYLFIFISLIALSSCKKFLDIQPESEVSKEELFSTEEGFKEALNGAYVGFAGASLYGGNLTFSNLDIMAQNYQFSSADYQRIAAFDYTLPSYVDKISVIWTNAYKQIGNVNQILEIIDQRKGIFKDQNYEIVKGEALALRAYMHFDLLRMFGTAYKSNPSFKAIPYVTTVSTKTTPYSAVTEVIDKVIADLQEAKSLLKGTDPIIPASYVVGYPNGEKATELKSSNLFLQNRRHRMNYFAVVGELARVYLYKGDQVNSLSSAKEVIDSQKFPWTVKEDFFNNDISKRDRIFYNEILFGWFVPKSQDQLTGLFSRDNPDYSATADQINSIYNLGTVGADDWRYKQWFRLVKASGTADRFYLQKYVVNSSPIANLHPLVAPALRLSEMYLIAAEASFDTNPSTAVEYFNTLRIHRGIGANVDATVAKNDFITLLEGEYRKEFYGESQNFFMHKRLNLGIITTVGLIYPPSDKIFVFPLPVDEQAYRN
ncbi:RagB/SusD family nutrient uptake outer membrane protein [Pedobacter endophyticus]|uniref:RagB/SusD family nutrient uptake outer membrane protein n=1 Tax=Pedobacter endophyticus TaxID=2789740 RepID=A0A7S9KZU3_9SPHI|nr:RagB/SusD family nutrient uptake outer membrane protein [Pedobacter endophyticus]QPH39634.1 RagB/SusD family nutrient uptake outer membrane protein [Pedobacter endophyticus]